MTALTQKEIAQDFDIYANRASSKGMAGASYKQVWFLAKLFMDKNYEPDQFFNISDSNSFLTKRLASKMIDDLLNNRPVAVL